MDWNNPKTHEIFNMPEDDKRRSKTGVVTVCAMVLATEEDIWLTFVENHKNLIGGKSENLGAMREYMHSKWFMVVVVYLNGDTSFLIEDRSRVGLCFIRYDGVREEEQLVKEESRLEIRFQSTLRSIEFKCDQKVEEVMEQARTAFPAVVKEARKQRSDTGVSTKFAEPKWVTQLQVMSDNAGVTFDGKDKYISDPRELLSELEFGADEGYNRLGASERATIDYYDKMIAKEYELTEQPSLAGRYLKIEQEPMRSVETKWQARGDYV